jgi:hypothetical protein
MTLLQDIGQVLRRAPAGRVVLTHVAEPSGKLGYPLAVAGLAHPLDAEVGRLQKLRPGDEGDAGSLDDFHGVAGR